MARDISIAISARDNFSQAITTMRNANQSFNKDLTGLQSKLNELNKTKITLKVDTDKAKTALKDAEKQFAKTGNAADKLSLELANANYENARRNLSLISDNARQAEKDIKNLTNAVSKSENRANKPIQSGGTSGIINSLAASGATKMIGDMFGSVATSWITSAYGAEAGTMASSALSSGAMGAAIGSAIAPGIGTAVGALGGAVVGYIQGDNAIFEGKDDAFKSYYEDMYSKVSEEQSQVLASGSSIAGIRETDKISFDTLLGGNSDQFLKSIVDFALITPFTYDDLTGMSKVLLAYDYKYDELIPLLQKVGDAGSALSMSNDDMKNVAIALGRMQVTDKTTLRYLNPLLERGIDVWSYLAEASGRTKKEVQEMVSKGLVPGTEAAKAIADYMGYDFAGNMEKQSKTYNGLVSILKDAQIELESSMGDGYNQTRKKGLEDETNWLNGDSGNSMKDAYNYIGQWKAYQENQAEQFQRDVMDSIMTGVLASNLESSDQRVAIERLMQEYTKANDDYEFMYEAHDEDGARKAGADMGRILAEAQAIATNEYNAGEGAQLALESNKTLAENIKNDSASQDAYWDAGYTMGQQFTRGLASAMKLNDVDASNETGFDLKMPKNPKDWLTKLGKEIKTVGKFPVKAMDWLTGNSHATGLSYVPYNNYPAILHEGERVLTASENRSRNTAGAQVTITGNNFTVRSEDDIEAIGQEIAKQIIQAYTLAP